MMGDKYLAVTPKTATNGFAFGLDADREELYNIELTLLGIDEPLRGGWDVLDSRNVSSLYPSEPRLAIRLGCPDGYEYVWLYVEYRTLGGYERSFGRPVNYDPADAPIVASGDSSDQQGDMDDPDPSEGEDSEGGEDGEEGDEGEEPEPEPAIERAPSLTSNLPNGKQRCPECGEVYDTEHETPYDHDEECSVYKTMMGED